jgi:hypothetical protein
MTLSPIGIIHSPHKQATGTPVQSALALGVQGMRPSTARILAVTC